MSASLNTSRANERNQSARVSVCSQSTQLLMDIIKKKQHICAHARLYEQMNVIIVTPLAFLYAHENCKHSNSCVMKRWRYTD